jgi:hypothetical protein
MSRGVGAPTRTSVRPRADEPVRDQHGGPGAGPFLLHGADHPLPLGGQVEVGRALECVLGQRQRGDPVHPERAPAPVGAGDHVPDVVLVDQAVRVRLAFRALVGEVDPALPHHRVLQPVDLGRPAGDVACAPRRRVDHGGLGGGLRLRAKRRRQRPDQFAQRGFRLAGDRGGRPDQPEQRLRLGRVQSTEVGAGPAEQLPAAVPARLRVDRDAGRRQCLQVAPGGGHRHLQLGRHLGSGDPAPVLHQQQGGNEAVGAHEPHLPG